MKIQMLSRQDDEGFFCFLLMWGCLYVKIHENDTVPPFPCSIFSLCTIFPTKSKSDLWYRKSDFFPFLLLNCFVFFFNVNFQKSICVCSWCRKTTLRKIFLGHTLEHSMAFTKNNARTGIPTCPLCLGATVGQWLCYLKIDSLHLMMQRHTVGSLHLLAFIPRLVLDGRIDDTHRGELSGL